MLDYRWQTFLLLCKTLSYTKTANELHVSQPTITHQIQYLEELYNVELFTYSNRKLQLTTTGEKLYLEVLKLHADNQLIINSLKSSFANDNLLRFWCTLTFGEYIMPKLLCQWLNENPNLQIQMQIKNTTDCLTAIEQGEIDFAFVEGYFNKAIYNSKVIKTARILVIAEPNHALAHKEQVILQDLFSYPLIIHQKESRLRGILPIGLSMYNYSYENFPRILQVGNANIIKKLVAAGKGIAFLYEDIVDEELRRQELVAIPVEGFELRRELSMVYLHSQKVNPLLETVYEEVLQYCRGIRNEK